MTCKACDRAVDNPDTGWLHTGCRGCDVRFASKQPRQLREPMVEDVRVREGEEAAAAFLRDVVDEFNRRQAWRRSVGRKDA